MTASPHTCASAHMSTTVPILRVTAKGETCSATDLLAVEEPLEIRLVWQDQDKQRREQSLSITMRTPGQERELAAGFVWSEGIVTRSTDIEGVEVEASLSPGAPARAVRVYLAPGAQVDMGRLQRHVYTTSSCGVCGKSSLEALEVIAPFAISPDGFALQAPCLPEIPARLRARQQCFERTGGLHAAGLFDAQGEILAVAEDVGRHNAVDKVIGEQLLCHALPLGAVGLMVSGRISFELVQKALMAGIPMLAAVGAPSSLAVSLGARHGMTLVGFVREGRFNVYGGGERLFSGDEKNLGLRP